jgi:hypothetical protein
LPAGFDEARSGGGQCPPYWFRYTGHLLEGEAMGAPIFRLMDLSARCGQQT